MAHSMSGDGGYYYCAFLLHVLYTEPDESNKDLHLNKSINIKKREEIRPRVPMELLQYDESEVNSINLQYMSWLISKSSRSHSLFTLLKDFSAHFYRLVSYP